MENTFCTICTNSSINLEHGNWFMITGLSCLQQMGHRCSDWHGHVPRTRPGWTGNSHPKVCQN